MRFFMGWGICHPFLPPRKVRSPGQFERPDRPSDGRLSDDLNSLRLQLLEALGTGRLVFLLGDLNIDLLRPEQPDTAQYSALLTELSLLQLVLQPTRPGDRPTLIDHSHGALSEGQTEAPRADDVLHEADRLQPSLLRLAGLGLVSRVW